jgi:hypothetical protein
MQIGELPIQSEIRNLDSEIVNLQSEILRSA